MTETAGFERQTHVLTAEHLQTGDPLVDNTDLSVDLDELAEFAASTEISDDLRQIIELGTAKAVARQVVMQVENGVPLQEAKESSRRVVLGYVTGIFLKLSGACARKKPSAPMLEKP